MKFPGRRLTALMATILVTCGLIATAGPAQAAGTATISRSIYLADSSTGLTYLPYAADRQIYLASATYTWTHTLDGQTFASRDIYLESGWYSWGCLLKGTGQSSQFGANYKGYCWLREENYEGGPAIGEVDLPYGAPDGIVSYVGEPLDRTVIWESQLVEH